MSTKVPQVLWNVSPIKVGSPISGTSTIYAFTYDGLLVSEPHHRVFREVRGRKATSRKFAGWSGGGPFYCRHVSHIHEGATDYGPVRYVGQEKGTSHLCGVIGTGIPLGNVPAMPAPASFESVRSDASQHYATGFRKARPGNPVASLGQFLVELRDLPTLPFKGLLRGKTGAKYAQRLGSVPLSEVPKVLYHRLDGFRGLGSNHLNIQFGWKPFVNDLRKMYNLWQTIDRRLAQLVRENGKYIRRRATVQDDSTVNQTETIYGFPWANVMGAPVYSGSGRTQYTVQTKTTTKVWFSGSFRYYVPDIGSSQWTARATAALFGALPTPELLWEVLPWSWLIDWFSNVGDVVSNASVNAVDNLTLGYSFIMKHVTTSTRATSVVWAEASSTSANRWPVAARTLSSVYQTDSKVRVGGGNPFGLDVKLESLTGHQLGILAALGLSRQKLL